ncbi:hypothetical protein Esti_004357 [Eimeria stiedai]
MQSFLEKLIRRVQEKETLLCVGIDPSLDCPNVRDLSQEEQQKLLTSLLTQCSHLVEQTAPFVCCFKPNLAFFEQYGPRGLEVLLNLCKTIPQDIPIILDAKRSAVGTAAEAYAHAFFSVYGGDCITLDPYLGKDGIMPFLKYKGKEPDLSLHGGLLGLVVGATYPEHMQKLRSLFPDLWFLAPGVGAQGGDMEAAINAGARVDGLGLIINVGRAISNSEDPGKAAQEFRDKMRNALKKKRQQASERGSNADHTNMMKDN